MMKDRNRFQSRPRSGYLLLLLANALLAPAVVQGHADDDAAPKDAAPKGEFTVEGRVIDEEGRPIAGVDVVVSRGMDTLRKTGPATTDADGRYRIRFGPGRFSAGPNLQFAIVVASKPGWYEKDLCRAGYLAMARFKPEGFRVQDWQVEGIVYPNEPYRVNFTMVPAASVSLKLVDREGEPLAGRQVRLVGDALYPASNVLWSGKTDEQGRAAVESVPLKSYYFSFETDRAEHRSDDIDFDRAAEFRFRLVYDDIAGALTAKQPAP